MSTKYRKETFKAQCHDKNDVPSSLRCHPEMGHFATPDVASNVSRDPVKGQNIHSFDADIMLATLSEKPHHAILDLQYDLEGVCAFEQQSTFTEIQKQTQ